MQDRENATHTAPKYLVWLREMSTRQLPYNNVILWATASCLHPLQFQHPGAILGRDLTRPETHSHCLTVPAFSLFTFLPLLSFILFVLFGVGKSRVDMLTSSFLCLAGAFFFLHFFFLKSAPQVLASQHWLSIPGLRVSYRP